MTKILMSGYTGDVGSVLGDNLIRDSYSILCLIRGEKTKPQEIKGDLTNYQSLLEATKNIEIVIHAAGLIKGGKKALQNVNIEGTMNLIKACGENGVKKIIFISSLDIKFNTLYGESKTKAEEIVTHSKLKYVILRPSVIYGKEFKKGITSLVKLLKKVPLIPVIGTGENLFQPLYINDLILLIKMIIDNDCFNDKIYFIGGAKTVSMNQLIDLICLKLSKRVVKINIPVSIVNIALKFISILGVDTNLGTYLTDKICSNEEIKTDFVFEPISIEEGLEKIIYRYPQLN